MKNYRRDHRPQTTDHRLKITILAVFTLMWSLGIFMPHPPTFAAEPIIIDHTAVEEFDQIPDEYIEEVKNLALHLTTPSDIDGDIADDGTDIIIGHFCLPAKYNIYVIIDGDDTAPLTLAEGPALHISLETNTPDEGYWSTENGRNATRAFADTGNYNYSMWVWDNLAAASYDDSFIKLYLETLGGSEDNPATPDIDESKQGFEQEYPNMRFIYMTRYVIDGGEIADNNNDMIRTYCEANDKVLFDVEDIMAYGIANDGYPPYYDDLSFSEAKAKAFWVMMAKLAGWGSGVVHDRMLGDVDGDGEITAYIDARLAARHGVGLYTLEGDALWAADVDGDGEITAYIDARLIARRALGLIDKFPIE